MVRSSTMMRVCAVVAMLALSLVCIGCHRSSTSVDTEAMVEAAVAESGVNVEDVAAVVMGRIITHQQVDDAISAERARYGLTNKADWDRYLRNSGTTEWDVRATTIHHMIDQTLVEIEAARLGIDLDDAVEQRMSSLESLYPSHAAFVDAVEARGYTLEGYAEAVRQSLLWDALCAAVITAPQPTPAQIRQYAVVVAPTLEGRRSSHILFSTKDYAIAVDVLDQLRAGADFAQLAAQYSIDSSAAIGGDMGWDCLNAYVEPYQNALDALEPGQVSDIILTRFGYHIVMCTDQYQVSYDANGDIDLAAIPQDLLQIITDSMSQSLTAQLFRHYIYNLEAQSPIAVFNEQGEQVPNEQVGLAVEVVEHEPTVDELAADIIESARATALDAVDQALAAIRSSSSVTPDAQDPQQAVDQAIEHAGEPHPIDPQPSA